MRFILILTHLAVSYDLQLYPQLGITIEDLKNTVIVTNGFMKTKLSIELRLPNVNPSLTQEECTAANNQTAFNNTVTAATNRFREQIKQDLAEFVDYEGLQLHTTESAPKINPVEKLTVSSDDVKKNPMLCDRDDVLCRFTPVLDNDEDNIKELKLRPCYNVDIGKVAKENNACHISKGLSICCAKNAARNNNLCPSKGMSQFYHYIHGNELLYPNKVHSINGGRKATQIQNYCVALQAVTIGGTRTVVGSYTDDDTTGRGIGMPKRRRRSARSRQRRSNWSYYTSGGFFTSTYIDNEISKVQEIEKIDNLQLKEAIAKNSKTLLTLKGDEREISTLQQVVCSSSEQLSEELVISELRNAQSKLEWKSELILRSCTNNLVPDQIPNEVLTKLCTAASSSSFCYGKDVRSLFSCQLKKPRITVDVVGIQVELIMNIPIDETYQSYKLHSIGVPYKSNAIDVSTNITALSTRQHAESSKQEISNDQVIKFLAQVFEKTTNSSSRSRREVLQTHHFLRVVSLPDIIIEFEGDLIGFSMKDVISTPWAKIVDYSNNKVRDTECVRSIMTKSVNKIPHYCEMKVESSNFNCLVKNLGKLGYFLSTSEIKPINDITSGQQSVFQNQKREVCESVCIIPVGPTEKVFSCGHRTYTVGTEPNTKVEVETVPLSKIKISRLTARKSEISDLTLSGFDFLDSSFLTKQNLRQSGTIATFITFIMAFILIFLVSKGILKRVYGCTAYYLCVKPCYLYHTYNNPYSYDIISQDDSEYEVYNKNNNYMDKPSGFFDKNGHIMN